MTQTEAETLKQTLDNNEDLGERFVLQLGGRPKVTVDGKDLDAKVRETE